MSHRDSPPTHAMPLKTRAAPKGERAFTHPDLPKREPHIGDAAQRANEARPVNQREGAALRRRAIGVVHRDLPRSVSGLPQRRSRRRLTCGNCCSPADTSQSRARTKMLWPPAVAVPNADTRLHAACSVVCSAAAKRAPRDQRQHTCISSGKRWTRSSSRSATPAHACLAARSSGARQHTRALADAPELLAHARVGERTCRIGHEIQRACQHVACGSE